MEYCSAIKKKEILLFAITWIDLEMIILSEVSQKEKDKYHIISLICGTLPLPPERKKKNKFIFTDTKNQLVVISGG